MKIKRIPEICDFGFQIRPNQYIVRLHISVHDRGLQRVKIVHSFGHIQQEPQFIGNSHFPPKLGQKVKQRLVLEKLGQNKHLVLVKAKRVQRNYIRVPDSCQQQDLLDHIINLLLTLEIHCDHLNSHLFKAVNPLIDSAEPACVKMVINGKGLSGDDEISQFIGKLVFVGFPEILAALNACL